MLSLAYATATLRDVGDLHRFETDEFILIPEYAAAQSILQLRDAETATDEYEAKAESPSCKVGLECRVAPQGLCLDAEFISVKPDSHKKECCQQQKDTQRNDLTRQSSNHDAEANLEVGWVETSSTDDAANTLQHNRDYICCDEDVGVLCGLQNGVAWTQYKNDVLQ